MVSSDAVLLLDAETVIVEQDMDVDMVAAAAMGTEMDFTGSREDASAGRGKDRRLFRNSRCCWSSCRFSVLPLVGFDSATYRLIGAIIKSNRYSVMVLLQQELRQDCITLRLRNA